MSFALVCIGMIVALGVIAAVALQNSLLDGGEEKERS